MGSWDYVAGCGVVVVWVGDMGSWCSVSRYKANELDMEQHVELWSGMGGHGAVGQDIWLWGSREGFVVGHEVLRSCGVWRALGERWDLGAVMGFQMGRLSALPLVFSSP